MDLSVSEPMAELFMEQCVGETSGHMAMIPNNPTLYGLCKAHRIENKADFALFLRQVADKLTVEPKF